MQNVYLKANSHLEFQSKTMPLPILFLVKLMSLSYLYLKLQPWPGQLIKLRFILNFKHIDMPQISNSN